MASTFKNSAGTATTTGAVVYTTPAATVGIVTAILLANKSGSAVTLTLRQYSAATSSYVSLLEGLTLPANSTMVPFDSQKLVLAAGDKLFVSSTVNDALCYSISVMEQA